MIDEVAMRASAAEQLARRARAGVLAPEDIREGFTWRGTDRPLVARRHGIFHPPWAHGALSLRTVFAAPGGPVWYADQRRAWAQIRAGDEFVDYAFATGGPDRPANEALRRAMRAGLPLLYLLGVAPGRYVLAYPTIIAEWSPLDLAARLVFAPPDGAPPGAAGERRDGLAALRGRLGRATFREALVAAYGGRCAITGLADGRGLDTARIAAGSDPDDLVLPNGLPLAPAHRAAFDADLLGIDPDHRLHVNPRLLAGEAGPALPDAAALAGRSIRPPRRPEDRPDRDRLAARFEAFRAAL